MPLRPINEYDYVLTVFWVDNFDKKVEKQTGSTFVNTTHMITFQERSEINLQENKGTPLPGSRKRKLEDETNKNQDREIFVNSKKEPPISTGKISGPTEEHMHLILLRYFLWLWIRKKNSFDQQHPCFQVRNFVFLSPTHLKKSTSAIYLKKKQVFRKFLVVSHELRNPASLSSKKSSMSYHENVILLKPRRVFFTLENNLLS